VKPELVRTVAGDPPVSEDEATLRIKIGERRAVCPRDLQARAARRVKFLGELVDVVFGVAEEIARDAAEPAPDAVLPRDPLDLIDGVGVAFGGHAGAVGAMHVLKPEKMVIQGAGEVGAGPPRFAASDPPILQHRHRLSFMNEVVGGGQAGDAGADHANIDGEVAIQRLAAHGGRRLEPEWRALA
jgi:hypothetical protein